ncbi:MAG: hypothetical protein JWP37_3052 [Mucilaginibacter sp.]|nr:hypothetical protein [Mucilaginibacter sp.]
MKKWLLIISVMLCFKNGFSQVDHDSFFKYSYLVLATNTPFKAADLNKGHTLQTEAGTCFFVRVKAKLFLVTTSHLTDQIDGFNQVRLPETFSNLEFRYYDDSTKNYEFSI